jgi:hypothetical protein
MPIRSVVTRALGTALALPIVCSTASAQAWLPPLREGSVTMAAQVLTADHLDRKGDFLDRGRVSSATLVTGVEYGLTELFSIDAKLAFVAAKHEGTDRLHGPLDTGAYHGAVQDARLALAMQVPTHSSLALAPYVAVILPTHDYETRGHSAPGRHLRSLQLGAWIGRDLDSVLPNVHVQGQYAFAFVERVGGMSINRSNLDLEVGYAPASFLTLTVATGLQRTHGGLEFPLPRDEHYDEVFPFHDRVAKDNRLLMSSGATVAVGSALSLYGTVVWTPWGQNTHAVKGVIIGASLTFGPALGLGGSMPGATDTQSRSSRPTGGFGR